MATLCRIVADAFTIDSFRPPLRLRNGHINAWYANRRQPVPEVRYRRERLQTPDGDFVDLDWLDGAAGGDGTTPILIPCHGMEGSSSSAYILRIMDTAARQGWRGVAFNFRTCSGHSNRLLQSYHGGFTDDLGLVVNQVAERWPGAPILLAGYSLGGSILANWLGRSAADVPDQVQSAFICCGPTRLGPASARVDRAAFGFYSRMFLRTMKRKVQSKADTFPGTFDNGAAQRARTLQQFDEAYTAPVHGFSSARDYYEEASAGPCLGAIAVPLLWVGAEDDPIITASAAPPDDFRSNPRLHQVWCRHGGHVGFSEGARSNWLADQAVAWFRHQA